jgi:carbonic anhydrase
MRILKNLFENNRQWAARMRGEDPAFFEKLATQQAPP